MPGFTDEERERIREQLIENGRELMLTYGPQKTTLEDITDPVGIAKPTFYQFFDAKADLLLVIFQREVEEYLENVRSELEAVEDPREALERFFRCYVEFGEGNKFIQRIVIEGDYQQILGGVSSPKIAEIEREEMETLVPFIEDIQSRSAGPIADMEPETVIGLMGSSLGWLILHQDDYDMYAAAFERIDDGYYEQMRELLITALARGLTVPDR